MRHDYYAGLARDEQRRKEAVQPRRGDIYDRNGNLLATSVGYQWLYVNPVQVEDPRQLALDLESIIGQPRLRSRKRCALLVSSEPRSLWRPS